MLIFYGLIICQICTVFMLLVFSGDWKLQRLGILRVCKGRESTGPIWSWWQRRSNCRDGRRFNIPKGVSRYQYVRIFITESRLKMKTLISLMLLLFLEQKFTQLLQQLYTQISMRHCLLKTSLQLQLFLILTLQIFHMLETRSTGLQVWSVLCSISLHYLKALHDFYTYCLINS